MERFKCIYPKCQYCKMKYVCNMIPATGYKKIEQGGLPQHNGGN